MTINWRNFTIIIILKMTMLHDRFIVINLNLIQIIVHKKTIFQHTELFLVNQKYNLKEEK